MGECDVEIANRGSIYEKFRHNNRVPQFVPIKRHINESKIFFRFLLKKAS